MATLAYTWDTGTILGSRVTFKLYYPEDVDGDTSKVSWGTSTSTSSSGSWRWTLKYDGRTERTGESGTSAAVAIPVSVEKAHEQRAVTFELTVTFRRSGYDSVTKTYSAQLTIPARTSYAVSFNANGGSGAPAAQVKWHDESLRLSSTKPTRSGYVFKRWSIDTSDSSPTYNPGDTYTENANLTLYATWNPTVTYNANGGTNAPATQTKTYGSALTLTSSTPTRANYVFRTWNTKADGTGYSYAPGATYRNDTAITLYAQWYAPYSVSFNANGGSGAPGAQVKVYNQTLTISSTRPTRAGYVFKRWNTNSSDTGTAYNPGSQYASNANLTLYAIWNPIVTYDANGGTGAPSSQTKTYGSALTLQTGTPTRTGYSFLRWNTAKDGTGTSYSPGGTMAAGSNAAVTLYAQWQKLPDAPTISSLTVVRSNASGNQDDTGEYCKVTAKWHVDTTNVSGNTATVTGAIQAVGGSPTVFTFSSGASGTSGTAVALVPNCNTDYQYVIAVTVTDRRTYTTRVAIMTRASFILDLKAGGTAVGIGSAAPDSGLEIGWPTQFDQAVGMLMGLSVGANLTVLGSIITDQLKVFDVTADVTSASSGWTVKTQSASTYGNVVMVTVTLSPTSAIAANSSSTVCTLYSGFRPKSAQGFADSTGVGSISSGGSCTYRNLVALSTTSTITVSATFLK